MTRGAAPTAATTRSTSRARTPRASASLGNPPRPCSHRSASSRHRTLVLPLRVIGPWSYGSGRVRVAIVHTLMRRPELVWWLLMAVLPGACEGAFKSAHASTHSASVLILLPGQIGLPAATLIAPRIRAV